MRQTFSLGRIAGIRISVNWSVVSRSPTCCPRLHGCFEGRALVLADGHLAGIVSPVDMSHAVERMGGTRGPFGTVRRWDGRRETPSGPANASS